MATQGLFMRKDKISIDLHHKDSKFILEKKYKSREFVFPTCANKTEWYWLGHWHLAKTH